MAVMAQSGVFSFGPQSAKGTATTTYYKHRAQDIDLDIISDDRLGPPEVGGIPTPTIPYRAGVISSGGALIMPRLENSFGWLLYGALGAVTSTTDKDVQDNTVTTMYNHEFGFSTTDSGYVPWMSFRKFIPGTNSTNSFGQVFQNSKIVGLTFTLPNDGLIQCRVDTLGIGDGTPYTEAPSWTYTNTTYEDWQSLPIGSVNNGFFKLPGYSATELPVVQATVSLQNAPLDLRQERVYGSPYLEDVTIVGRQLTVDMVVKWTDPNLYQAVLTGSTTGTQWTAQPFTSNLDLLALSSTNASGVSPATPWGLRVRADKVMYQIVGGVRLAGGQSLMMRIQGTAIDGGSYYAKINLGNKTTAYTWPT